MSPVKTMKANTVKPIAPKIMRQQLVTDARRTLILDAARSAFFELGLEGASLREIAKRAGYTPGAIYSYFDSKEAVYATLLGESLDRLNAHIEQALVNEVTDITSKHRALKIVEVASSAFFQFYWDNPKDLDLGFYLFHGMQPRGLTPQWNTTLNARLKQALEPIESGLTQLGQSSSQAVIETTALFAHVVGLLVLSHTGRIRLFKVQAHGLFEQYLELLLNRVNNNKTRKKSSGV